jgi:hypothetical protein
MNATDSQKRQEFIKEAQRIEEATMHSSKGHFTAAALWRGMHVGLGVPTTILASIVAASVFSKMDSTHSVGGWISIAVAVLSALTTSNLMWFRERMIVGCDCLLRECRTHPPIPLASTTLIVFGRNSQLLIRDCHDTVGVNLNMPCRGFTRPSVSGF